MIGKMQVIIVDKVSDMHTMTAIENTILLIVGRLILWLIFVFFYEQSKKG